MSLQRELRQCSSGLNVDSIIGNQKNKAVFTLLPPEGAGESVCIAVLTFCLVSQCYFVVSSICIHLIFSVLAL